MQFMVPQPSFEEQVNSLTYAINDLNRFGITSIVDAGGSRYPQAQGLWSNNCG
jgi:predicted amidohydrolase YtcJ